MNTIIHPIPNQVTVIIGGKSATSLLLKTAFTFAEHSQLYLLDGSGRTNPFIVGIELSLETDNPKDIYDRIFHTPVFTCRQMVEALQEISSVSKPVGPVFALDFLSTFYEESVPYHEARTLLEYCINFLRVISRNYPVIISVYIPKNKFPGRKAFFNQLCYAANQVLHL